MLILSFFWARDLGRESNYSGGHVLLSQTSLKLGIGFFIFREVIFFFHFFELIYIFH